LISKNSLIIPLLARRGAETNERSEFVEAGWWKLRKDHHPVSRHSLCSVWIHPSWPGGELFQKVKHEDYRFYVNFLIKK
jgi:hypothetical protein